MSKTDEDIRVACETHRVGFIPVRDCSICGHMLGYIVYQGEPFYDSSCNCGSCKSLPRISTWADVASTYNDSSGRSRETLDLTFHFTPETPDAAR